MVLLGFFCLLSCFLREEKHLQPTVRGELQSSPYADLPPKLISGCLDPSRVCGRFRFSVLANSMYAWRCASHVLVVLLVCVVTSLFVFDYFYRADFVSIAKSDTLAILKQIPLVNVFAMDLKNTLAYDQLKDDHRWHTVGACLLFMGALRASWSRFALRGGGRGRLKSSLPPRCCTWHPGSCLMARWWLLLRPELCSLFFLDGMLSICFFGTDYGYLKASVQAVICNSIKITQLVQTKGPPGSVCHHSVIGICGTVRTGWAGRDTFYRKSFSSDRQFRGFRRQRQYILI